MEVKRGEQYGVFSIQTWTEVLVRVIRDDCLKDVRYRTYRHGIQVTWELAGKLWRGFAVEIAFNGDSAHTFMCSFTSVIGFYL